MLIKYTKLLLEKLLKSGYAIDQRSYLDTFPARKRQCMLNAIDQLVSELMITRDQFDDRITIILPNNKISEAFRFVSVIQFNDNTYSPIEEKIPKKYTEPFLIKKGEKQIHGKVSQYVFCHTYTDPSDVTCFVINHNGDVHPIHLGSIFDPASKISAFLKEIDQIFKNSLFTREDLKTYLPKKLIQNNQPTKAVVEYLCYKNFLIRLNSRTSRWSKFQRTGKKHPITTIDEIVSLHEPTSSTTMNHNGGAYGYHEEDGIYPIY